jgi:hypothetical protein
VGRSLQSQTLRTGCARCVDSKTFTETLLERVLRGLVRPAVGSRAFKQKFVCCTFPSLPNSLCGLLLMLLNLTRFACLIFFILPKHIIHLQEVYYCSLHLVRSINRLWRSDVGRILQQFHAVLFSVCGPALLRFGTEADYHSSSISNLEEMTEELTDHVMVASVSHYSQVRQIIIHL